jgi:hypothetical protein
MQPTQRGWREQSRFERETEKRVVRHGSTPLHVEAVVARGAARQEQWLADAGLWEAPCTSHTGLAISSSADM